MLASLYTYELGSSSASFPWQSSQDIPVLRTELIAHLIHSQATKSNTSFHRSLDFEALK